MAVLTRSVVTEIIKASRAEQGLPPTVRDSATIRAVAQLLQAQKNEIAAVHNSAATSSSEVRRAAVEPTS